MEIWNLPIFRKFLPTDFLDVTPKPFVGKFVTKLKKHVIWQVFSIVLKKQLPKLANLVKVVTAAVSS